MLAYIPSPSDGVWHLGPFPLRAYALGIIIGALVAIWIGERRYQARGGRAGVIGDVAIWAIPFGIIGARIYHVATDAAAMSAFDLLCKTEGIIPAIESAHALAGALELAKELGPDSTILVNLSGRGDKDVHTAAEYFGLIDEPVVLEQGVEE